MRVVADATAEAIEHGQRVVSLVLAQKPFDMGYLAVQFAVADNAGEQPAAPRRDSFAIIDEDNVSGPESSRFIYKAD